MSLLRRIWWSRWVDIALLAISLGCAAWVRARVRAAGARAVAAEAEAARLKVACNICEQPWPNHAEACAYPANVRDKEAAEAEVARLRDGLRRAVNQLQGNIDRADVAAMLRAYLAEEPV